MEFFAEFFDLKVIAILVSASLWMPLARLIWRAVNPYPHLLKDKRERRDGPLLDMPLVSEEWAGIRLERSTRRAPSPVQIARPGFRPALRRLGSEEAAERSTLRRTA